MDSDTTEILRVRTNGLDLECVAQGSGEPMVLVHGDVSDRRTWSRLAPRLARRYRVVTYSRRLHWPNPPPALGEGSLVEAHAADLAAILARVGPAHVVANSYGAYVAMTLAAARPELFLSLVLEEPAAVPLAIALPPTPESLAALAQRDPELHAATLGVLEVVGRTIEAFVAGDVARGVDIFTRYHVPEAIAADKDVLARALDNGAAHVAALLVGHFSPLPAAEVARIRVPTLVVVGSESPAYLRVLADRIVRLVPGARRADLSGLGHFMHEEDADATMRAIVPWLTRAHHE